ncbi:MAG: copper resistance protein CopC [Corynebacterium sp.]|uniref:copper resistance CopC family protein n=1 Tax=Corynebacterium sp. TaxID=1720 RepID=UPI0026DCC0F6|nr:copper resistance CopC family protein [Corynebacterium sp.]MDO5097840.1 copper resistance protein CopC [Corynebacterium sp.]
MIAVAFVLLGMGAVALVSPGTIVSAHDVVVGGAPKDGEVLTTPPEKIVLEFSGEPKTGFNTLAVTDSNGHVLFRGEPSVEGRNIVLDVPGDINFSPGQYTIGFQITSSDGHSTRGKTTFSIQQSGASSTSSGQETQPNTSSSEATQAPAQNSATWIKVGAGVGIIVVLSSFIIIVLRNRKAR